MYYAAGRWIYVLIGIAFGAGAVYVIWLQTAATSRIGFTTDSDLLFIFAMLMIVLMAAVFLAYGLRNRIVVTPERIEYHSLAIFTLISPWSNAERIIDIGSQPWLVLKDAEAVTGRPNPVLLIWRPELRERAIPVGALWVNHEGLLADIRRYAPQVGTE